MAKNIIDAFVTSFAIDSSGLKSDAKDVQKTFDKLEKKAQNTGETVYRALSTPKRRNSRRGQGINLQQQIKDIIPEEENKKIEKAGKNLKKTKKSVDELEKSVSGLGTTFRKVGKSILDFITPEVAMTGLAGFTANKLFDMTRNIANANTPYFYASQQLNTPIGTLSGLGQSISLTGGNPSNILAALGAIGMAQTQTRIFGTSQMNPYFNALGVPIAINGKARKPLDVLLGLSSALRKNVANKRLTTQDAYNILSQMGFSPDVGNFIMQGRSKILSEMHSQGAVGTLTKQQVEAFKQITASSAQAANALANLGRTLTFQLAPNIIRLNEVLTQTFESLSYSLSHKMKTLGKIGYGYLGSILPFAPIVLGSDTLTRSNFKDLRSKIHYADMNYNGGIASLIRGGESHNNYNAYNSGTNSLGYLGYSGANANISNMTIGQIMAIQSQTQGLSYSDPNRVFAVGAYQFTPNTLKRLVTKYKINPNSVFNKKMQNRLANYLIMQDINSRDPIGSFKRDWTSLDSYSSNQIMNAINRRNLNKTNSNISTNHVQTQTHIGTINVQTNATDAPGIAKSIGKYLDYITPMQANLAVS